MIDLLFGIATPKFVSVKLHPIPKITSARSRKCRTVLGTARPPEPRASSWSSGKALFLDRADVIFGIGCSFSETNFGIAMPKGKSIIHATLEPDHLNKDVAAQIGLIGDAGLTLDALLAELSTLIPAARDSMDVAR